MGDKEISFEYLGTYKGRDLYVQTVNEAIYGYDDEGEYGIAGREQWTSIVRRNFGELNKTELTTDELKAALVKYEKDGKAWLYLIDLMDEPTHI